MRVLILGASGYVGGELLRLLGAHPELRAARLTGNAQAGEAVEAVKPALRAQLLRQSRTMTGRYRHRSPEQTPEWKAAPTVRRCCHSGH